MKNLLFRIVTGIAGFYHLVLGVGGLVLPSDTFVKVSSFILGMSTDVDASSYLIVKFGAAYVMAFGIMLILLCIDPVKNRILMIPALSLFGVRLINKIIFFSAIGSAFEITTGRNVFAILSLLFLIFAMLLTMPKKSVQ